LLPFILRAEIVRFILSSFRTVFPPPMPFSSVSLSARSFSLLFFLCDRLFLPTLFPSLAGARRINPLFFFFFSGAFCDENFSLPFPPRYEGAPLLPILHGEGEDPCFCLSLLVSPIRCRIDLSFPPVGVFLSFTLLVFLLSSRPGRSWTLSSFSCYRVFSPRSNFLRLMLGGTSLAFLPGLDPLLRPVCLPSFTPPYRCLSL